MTENIVFDINKGLICAPKIPPAKPTPRLFHGIYRGGVTLLVGEAGAGKSSLIYNIGIHAANNRPLWNLPFGTNRSLNVLMIDPENCGNFENGDGGVTAKRLARIRQDIPANLLFHSGQGLVLSCPEHLSALSDLIVTRRIDLVFMDPYVNLFLPQNENDNGEAMRYAKRLVAVARQTNCAIVLVHHTGKAGEEFGNNPKFGRGASALFCAVDVAMTLRSRAGTPDKGSDDEGDADSEAYISHPYVRLKIEKNRFENRLTSLYLQKAGDDQFIKVESKAFFNSSAGREKSAQLSKKEESVRQRFLDIAKDGREIPRSEYIRVAGENEVRVATADSILKALVDEGYLSRETVRHGKHVFRWQRTSTEGTNDKHSPTED